MGAREAVRARRAVGDEVLGRPEELWGFAEDGAVGAEEGGGAAALGGRSRFLVVFEVVLAARRLAGGFDDDRGLGWENELGDPLAQLERELEEAEARCWGEDECSQAFAWPAGHDGLLFSQYDSPLLTGNNDEKCIAYIDENEWPV